MAALLLTGCDWSGTSACEDLRPLNQAVRGDGLSAEQQACLERRLASKAETQHREVSTLLLWQARSHGEAPAWAARAREHVAQYPDDLEVWVQLANQQQRQGPAGAEQSLADARAGLAWLQRHPAETPAQRRAYHDLLKARAVAAEMLAPPNAPSENMQRTARFARDWWVVARSLGLPKERAMAMCINAGATPAFCRGEAD